MSKSRKGQVFLEYVLIVVVISMAILIGGSALKRSIFGSLKIQEDSVIDSFSEQLRQSTTGLIPPASCSCSPWIDGICGANRCAPTQMVRMRTCTPINCDTEERCEGRETCCTTPGAQSLKCGSLVGGLPANPSADVIDTPARNPVNTTYLPATLGTFEGTVSKDGVDTMDCLVGQMLVSRTCGVAPVVGDPTDPAQQGKSLQVSACTVSSPECQPGCWGTIEAGSSACNTASATDEYGRAGNNLNAEVSYRKTGGVIISGVLNTDNPSRAVMAASSATVINPAYVLPHPPYNSGASVADIDQTIYMGTWLMPWTYFASPTGGGSATECSATRKCERMCAAGATPSSTRSSCILPQCDNITHVDQSQASFVGGNLTFLTPPLKATTAFSATVTARNLNFIMGCFNLNGDLMPTAGGSHQELIFAYPNAACTSAPFTVSGKSYCYQDGVATNPASSSLSASCTDSAQTLVRVHNSAPTADAADMMSYTIIYQKKNIGADVLLLADESANVYLSDTNWHKLRLLYSSASASPAASWQFPAQFYAEGSSDGKIHLIVEQLNALKIGTDGNSNPGGVSLQMNGSSGASCFTEATPVYNTHGGRAIPTPTEGAWNNTGCWIYSALNTGLDQQGVMHEIRVQADLDGGATCSSTPPTPPPPPPPA